MLNHAKKIVCSFAILLVAAGAFPPAVALAQSPAPAQDGSLAAKKAPDGVLFQCLVPDASAVYLAGDFNGWADNADGRISDAQFRLEGPDKGVWHKVVKLDAGEHKFRFNVGGGATGWFTPEWATTRDADGNAVLTVTAGGDVLLRSPVNPAWKPQVAAGKVTFHYYAPSAHAVYLADDANQWGENKDSVVSNPNYAMALSGADGAWQVEVPLAPGRHAYKFVVDGNEWVTDPNAPETDAEGHSIVVVR